MTTKTRSFENAELWMGPIDSTVNFLVGAGECVCCPGNGGRTKTEGQVFDCR